MLGSARLRSEPSPCAAQDRGGHRRLRTKSGKITELVVRNVVHGRAIKNKKALANPEALELFKNLPQLKPKLSSVSVRKAERSFGTPIGISQDAPPDRRL